MNKLRLNSNDRCTESMSHVTCRYPMTILKGKAVSNPYLKQEYCRKNIIIIYTKARLQELRCNTTSGNSCRNGQLWLVPEASEGAEQKFQWMKY